VNENAELQPITDLQTLLFESDINKVVYVDDLFGQVANVEEVIAICWHERAESKQIAGKIPRFKKFNFSNQDALSNQIRNAWDKISSEEQELIYHRCTEINGNKYDFDAKLKLNEIISQALSNDCLIELSLKEWRNEKSELLKNSDFQNTLFLIDEDFSKEGGGEKEGLEIIYEIIKSNEKSRPKCGLLSHNYNENNEFEVWKMYAEELSIDQDCFFLIPKNKLKKEGLEFIRSLKLLILNKDCNELKLTTKNVLNNSFQEAIEKIEKINIVDFENIVFKQSNREGIWEPDSLLKMFTHFYGQIARNNAIKTKKLWSQSSKIRKISGLPYGRDYNRLDPTGLTWKQEREEIYESPDYFNSLHLPIELGDIFQDLITQKCYIIISQPCDLMVRNNGKRALDFITVGEILNKEEQSQFSYKLPLFNEDNGEHAYVSLRTVDIRALILDLCVFNSSGEARFKSNQECAKIMFPAWKKRIDLIHGALNLSLEKAEKLKNKGYFHSDIKSLAIPSSSLQSIFQSKYNLKKKTIFYNCKRVLRLNTNYAQDLLRDYGNYISRLAK
jgi:hypothetical protein